MNKKIGAFTQKELGIYFSFKRIDIVLALRYLWILNSYGQVMLKYLWTEYNSTHCYKSLLKPHHFYDANSIFVSVQSLMHFGFKISSVSLKLQNTDTVSSLGLLIVSWWTVENSEVLNIAKLIAISCVNLVEYITQLIICKWSWVFRQILNLRSFFFYLGALYVLNLLNMCLIYMTCAKTHPDNA